MDAFDVEGYRSQFPALARQVGGRPAVYFDGPGGSQVPRAVIDAVAHCLGHANANTHGAFATALETDEILREARRAAADFFGTGDPSTIAFGPNMTTLTFALSRALARGWGPEDEVVVTDLDHDANVTPWARAAADAGATVRRVRFRTEDGTLDLDDLRAKVGPRTRLVAAGCASNALGTINPVREITEIAHRAGALVFLDAVHHAPHALIDVEAWGCDFLSCSAYKFFGPHVGLLYGRRPLLESLPAYKVRPASDAAPDRWETGTQNHEGIAGTLAAIDYLAAIGRDHDPAAPDRRSALRAAWDAIRAYESGLTLRLLEMLARAGGVRVYGLTDPRRVAERTPTCSFTHARRTPRDLAEHFAAHGIFTWDGNFYALGATGALGLEPTGLLRVGLLHYNTVEEIDRLEEALRAL